jgi:hypothetical protein
LSAVAVLPVILTSNTIHRDCDEKSKH